MNDPIRILTADHREVKQLLKRLADTDEGRERNELAREIQTKLTAHMDIEESIVYPPVGEDVGEEDREEAEIEHRLARQGLDTVMSMLEQPGFGAAVQMLIGGIEHHVEEEESQLLPELKDAMDRDEWAALGDAIADAKRAAGLPVPKPTARRSAKRGTRSGGAKRTGESKARKTASSAKKSSSTATKRTSTRTASKRSTAKSGGSSRASSGSKR